MLEATSQRNLPILVITRPKVTGQNLVRSCLRFGLPVFSLPTIEVRPDFDVFQVNSVKARLSGFDLCVFTSRIAIIQARKFRFFSCWPKSVSIAVLGQGSYFELLGTPAKDSGCDIFFPHKGVGSYCDSESLWKALKDHYGLEWSRFRVLLLRGVTGRDYLLNKLINAGAFVEVLPCYRRFCPKPSSLQLGPLYHWIKSKRKIAFATSSNEGLCNLSFILKHADVKLRDWWLGCLQIVSHPRQAHQARMLGCRNVKIAREEDIINTILSSYLRDGCGLKSGKIENDD